MLAENECAIASKNDCAKDAICTDTDDGFFCQCKNGFFDDSAKQQKQPGRICVELKNECQDRTADCSSDADCIDTPDSYFCRCKEGFKDDSTDPVNRPGRKCAKGNRTDFSFSWFDY